MFLKNGSVLTVAGIAATLAFIIGVLVGSSMITATEQPASMRPAVKMELLEFSDAFAEIAEKLNPSVVNITCTEHGEDVPTGDSNKEENQENLDDQLGFGSGVIIDPQGYILTSNHVVESAEKIEVKLSDNRKFFAKMVGQDRETDLALIKVEPDKALTAAPLGDSDKLRPGQWVMAIGNPFVYDHTVTVGVISALNRDLDTDIFDNFIQTDAAINFGNSGGPLLNIRGEVIGINTLISSQGTGIGFAIPINIAKNILPQLKELGHVSRGFLGLTPQDITPELQSSLRLQSTEGIVISSIRAGTPAERVGLKRYDVIIEMNGTKIQSENQFRKIVAESKPGTKLNLKVLRENKPVELVIEVAERSEMLAGPRNLPNSTPDRTGLRVSDLLDEYRREFEVPPEVDGIVVLQVRTGLAAEEAGLQRGDIILEVNKIPSQNASSFEQIVKSSKSGDVLLLYIYRSDSYQFITLTIP
jgi:serine protease Do